MTPSMVIWEYRQIVLLENEKSARKQGYGEAIEDKNYEEWQASQGITPEKLKEARKAAGQ